jgi:hypothetical protein
MKKWLVLPCVTVLSLLAVSAGATTMQVGFKGGLAIADLTGDDVDSDSTDTRTGFVGGGFAQMDLSRNFGVRLEALYHMKGAEGKGINSTWKLDYFEFPLLLVGKLPASETVSVSAFAGPVLGLNTNAEIEGSSGILTASLDIGDYIAGFEFGLAFGLGLEIDVSPVVIAVDGRYDLGLTTIDDGLGEFLFGPGVELDAKNSGFVFMAGVGFPIGGGQ